MTLVPCKKTPLSQDQAFDALGLALRAENVNSGQALSLLAAHSALETGKWASMYNFNFGNIGAGGGDSFRLEDCSVATPAGNPAEFAAYGDARIGADALVSLIKRRYTEAWTELTKKNPDPYAYVQRLKNRGYFTAPLGPYADGVARIYAEYTGRAGPSRPLPNRGADSDSSSSSAHWVMLSTSLLRSCDDTKKLAILRLKDQGPDVLFLRSLLGMPHSIHYDVITMGTVRDFQNANHLVPDGICGPKTWGALKKIIGGA